MTEILSWNQRIGQLAGARPDKTATAFIPHAGEHRRVSWRELEETAIQNRALDEGLPAKMQSRPDLQARFHRD